MGPNRVSEPSQVGVSVGQSQIIDPDAPFGGVRQMHPFETSIWTYFWTSI